MNGICERVSLRWLVLAGCVAVALAASGCADPEYDTSTPELTLEAMNQMLEDGRADLLGRVIHVEPRDITYADGVTEQSAITEVIGKTGDLLGQLHRVSRKLGERFPGQVVDEASIARGEFGFMFGSDLEKVMGTFLADPFRYIDRERDRLSAVDLGDGTAAVLWDGAPPFGGVGLQMIQTSEGWKIDIPVATPPISQFRPETREEWAVLASMMLGFENALKDFEVELDAGEFKTLADASGRAGLMLGQSAVVQGMIYAFMKEQTASDSGAADAGAEGG